MACFKCGELGHKKIDCPTISMRCLNCNKLGHLSQNCRSLKADDYYESGDRNFRNNYNEKNQAYRGNSKNRAYSKGRGKNEAGKECYNCKEFGHVSRDCLLKIKVNPPVKVEVVCKYCKATGHKIEECKNLERVNKKNQEKKKIEKKVIDFSIKCYKCQELGHIFKNCKYK